MFDEQVANPHYTVRFTVIPEVKNGFIRRMPLESKQVPFCMAGIEQCRVNQQKPIEKDLEAPPCPGMGTATCPHENHQEQKLIQPNRPFDFIILHGIYYHWLFFFSPIPTSSCFWAPL